MSCPPKGYLMTPGPTPVPPEVEAAMAQPIVYHRGPEFQAVLARVFERLKDVFRTSGDVLLLTASGSAAMESAVANLVSPGDPVLVVSSGYFGERWAQIAERYGVRLTHLRYAWGETPDPDDVAAKLAEMGGARALFCTQCETSTGVVADIRAIAARGREAGSIVAVDAISCLGAVPLEQHGWAIDVVVSGSQKALMTPPGLAFAALSDEAVAAARESTSPRFYLDWERALAAQADGRTPFTPAVSLIRGLDVALDLLLRDGLETVWDRSRRLGRACREAVKAMGLELFSPDEDRSAVVTAIRVPERIDSVHIVRTIRERFGITVAGGQGELRGKIVRIGHIGYVDLDDLVAALAAVEDAVERAGAPVERGVAAGRARASYEEGVPAPAA